MQKFVLLLTLGLFFYIPSSLGSVRENEFGAGPVISALGGSGAAFVSGPESAHLNPANLSRCKKSNAHFGLRHISTHLNVDVTSGSTREVNQLGTLFSFEFGGCLVPFDNFGIGLWTSSSILDPMSLAVSTPNTDFTFLRSDKSLSGPTLVAGLGYAFIPEISLGLAVSVAMHAHITQDVYAPLTDNGKTFSTEITANVKPRSAVIAGVSFLPWNFIGLAATFRTENSGQLEIPAKTQAAMVLPIPPIRVVLSSLFNYAPKQFSLGLFGKPFDFLSLTADLDYVLWSEFPGPFIKVTPNESSSVSNGIPLPVMEPFKFHNVLVPKGGIEAQLGDSFAIRSGYRWHPAIIDPNPSHSANLLDQETHTVSLGGGYKIETPSLSFNLDLFAAAHIMPKRSVQKDTTLGSLAYTYGGVLVSTGLAAKLIY